jgi:hypothetical protein
MQNHPHQSDMPDTPADATAPCDLDALVPPTRRSDWINWMIGFAELSGLVIFLSIFIFLMVRHFFGIGR